MYCAYMCRAHVECASCFMCRILLRICAFVTFQSIDHGIVEKIISYFGVCDLRQNLQTLTRTRTHTHHNNTNTHTTRAHTPHQKSHNVSLRSDCAYFANTCIHVRVCVCVCVWLLLLASYRSVNPLCSPDHIARVASSSTRTLPRSSAKSSHDLR